MMERLHMMREYHSLADRTITEEHCKKYFSLAEPGAVFRICDDIKGNDRMGNYKHSQILLQQDGCGVTIYESNDTNTSIAYYTWEKENSNKRNRIYLRYQEEEIDYIVILEAKSEKRVQLITGYPVFFISAKKDYENDYKNYMKNL